MGAGRPYIFQQDGQPAHNSNRTQQWCQHNLLFIWEKEVLPPSSPDCNPLVYFVCGVAKRDVNQTSHNTKQVLKDPITEVFKDIPRADVVKAGRRIRSWLEKVEEANSDFFK